MVNYCPVAEGILAAVVHLTLHVKCWRGSFLNTSGSFYTQNKTFNSLKCAGQHQFASKCKKNDKRGRAVGHSLLDDLINC